MRAPNTPKDRAAHVHRNLIAEQLIHGRQLVLPVQNVRELIDWIVTGKATQFKPKHEPDSKLPVQVSAWHFGDDPTLEPETPDGG